MVKTASCLFNKLQLTLCIIKPDISPIYCKTMALRRYILKNGFLFIRSKHLTLSKSDAEKFYHQHKDKFFFNRLVTFMSSGPIWAHILAHPNAIKFWRSIIGPTKVYRAIYEAPTTIRAQFGLTDTRNAVHGSDSEDSAREEISFYFKDFSQDQWKDREENLFSHKNLLEFDQDSCTHRLKQNAPS